MVKRFAFAASLGLVFAAVVAAGASAAFSNTRLLVPLTQSFPGVVSNTTGDSEPSISIGTDGHMVVGGLAWIPFQVNMWTGTAGSTPSFFGAMDQNVGINGNGRFAVGDGDEDFDLGTTGTIHFADLIFVVTRGTFKLGVAETNCPRGATSPSQCNERVLDTAGADRQWITSNGRNVWLSYHDSGNSAFIRTFKSTDDGDTWSHAGSPVVGQGDITGNSTFNNLQGPIVADPQDANRVFDVFLSGTEQSKCCNADFNLVNVSTSTDGGKSYSAKTIFAAPTGTSLVKIFPWLAVDPVTDYVYVAWTDGHGVKLAISTDHGQTFPTIKTVSSIRTTVFPEIAAYNGKVDVTYYGSTGSSNLDPNAVWNTYDAQSMNSGLTFTQLQVSNTPNHFGAICTGGTGCGNPLVTRTLLDLFEVAENPLNGKASIIYTDDTFNQWSLNGTTYQLPEIVLAQEN
jgi:hypothetical protein